MSKDLTEFANKQTPEQVVERMEQLWINAFSSINPTNEFKIDLANQILDMIDRTDHREFGAKITYIKVATS